MCTSEQKVLPNTKQALCWQPWLKIVKSMFLVQTAVRYLKEKRLCIELHNIFWTISIKALFWLKKSCMFLWNTDNNQSSYSFESGEEKKLSRQHFGLKEVVKTALWTKLQIVYSNFVHVVTCKIEYLNGTVIYSHWVWISIN